MSRHNINKLLAAVLAFVLTVDTIATPSFAAGADSFDTSGFESCEIQPQENDNESEDVITGWLPEEEGIVSCEVVTEIGEGESGVLPNDSTAPHPENDDPEIITDAEKTALEAIEKAEITAEDLSIFTQILGADKFFDVIFVTYVGDANCPKAQSIQGGNKVTEPEYSCTLPGKVFAGWFKEPECQNQWNFASDIVMEDTKLFAKFSETRMKPGYTWADKSGEGRSYDAGDYAYAKKVTKIVFSPNEPSSSADDWDASADNSKSVFCYLNASGTTLTIHAKKGSVLANEDSSYMFAGRLAADEELFSSLESIEGLEYLNTSDTTDMSSMFYELRNYKEGIKIPFNTENVTDMSYMFCNFGSGDTDCIDLAGFYTPNLENMNSMFMNTVTSGGSLSIWLEKANEEAHSSSNDESFMENQYFLTENVTDFNNAFKVSRNTTVYSYNFDLNNPIISGNTDAAFGNGNVYGQKGHHASSSSGPIGAAEGNKDSAYLRIDTYKGSESGTDPEGDEYGYWGGFTQPCFFVTFDLQGGKMKAGEENPQRVGYEECASEPSKPTGTGTFTGWYTDSACTELYDFSEPVYEDMTIYAGWEQDCTVKFNYPAKAYLSEGYPLVQNVPEDQTVPYGMTAVDPGEMIDTDHTSQYFLCWSTDPVKICPFDFSTPVKQNLTLYARFGVIVKYNLKGIPGQGGIDAVETDGIELDKDGCFIDYLAIDPECGWKVTDRENGGYSEFYKFLTQGTEGFSKSQIDFWSPNDEVCLNGVCIIIGRVGILSICRV